MKKKVKIILGIIGVLILVGGLVWTFCFKKNKDVEVKPEVEVPKVEEPKLKILDLDSNTRSIAVMINNMNPIRKYHTGLNDAYLVYEIIVEGGITRLMAIFKDKDTAKIGSVRSARPYYLDYALENDAIYVHFGFSEQASSDINKLGVNNINGLVYDGVYFWREKSLPVASEHTGYTSMKLINDAISKLNYRNTSESKPLLNYSVEEIDMSTIEGVKPANTIDIQYSTSVTTSYVYDEVSKTYLRSVNKVPHTDYDTKEQYKTKNIITYQVSNKTVAGDSKGRQVLNNIGKGEGYYISNGYAIPITWEKSSRNSKTIYKLKNGSELKVNDGNTYIQIQPVGVSININ